MVPCAPFRNGFVSSGVGIRSLAAANFQNPWPLVGADFCDAAGALTGPLVSATIFSGVAALVLPCKCLKSSSCAGEVSVATAKATTVVIQVPRFMVRAKNTGYGPKPQYQFRNATRWDASR